MAVALLICMQHEAAGSYNFRSFLRGKGLASYQLSCLIGILLIT